MKKIELGDTVKDLVTGFKGIAVGCTTWLYGCNRITIQPEGINKEGKTFESQSFDEPQLILIKRAKNKNTPNDHETGRPNAEPKSVSYKF